MVALDQAQRLDEMRTGWLSYIFATDVLGTVIDEEGATVWAMVLQTFSRQNK